MGCRQTVSKSFKYHYFSCLSRTSSSQRIVLTGKPEFPCFKNDNIDNLFRAKKQPPEHNCQYLKNKKVNINFNTCCYPPRKRVGIGRQSGSPPTFSGTHASKQCFRPYFHTVQ